MFSFPRLVFAAPSVAVSASSSASPSGASASAAAAGAGLFGGASVASTATSSTAGTGGASSSASAVATGPGLDIGGLPRLAFTSNRVNSWGRTGGPWFSPGAPWPWFSNSGRSSKAYAGVGNPQGIQTGGMSGTYTPVRTGGYGVNALQKSTPGLRPGGFLAAGQANTRPLRPTVRNVINLAAAGMSQGAPAFFNTWSS